MSTANTTERQQRYLQHTRLVTDDICMLRAGDVQRLYDELPPSFDPLDFTRWLSEQQLPPRCAQKVRETLEFYRS